MLPRGASVALQEASRKRDLALGVKGGSDPHRKHTKDTISSWEIGDANHGNSYPPMRQLRYFHPLGLTRGGTNVDDCYPRAGAMRGFSVSAIVRASEVVL